MTQRKTRGSRIRREPPEAGRRVTRDPIVDGSETASGPRVHPGGPTSVVGDLHPSTDLHGLPHKPRPPQARGRLHATDLFKRELELDSDRCIASSATGGMRRSPGSACSDCDVPKRPRSLPLGQSGSVPEVSGRQRRTSRGSNLRPRIIESIQRFSGSIRVG